MNATVPLSAVLEILVGAALLYALYRGARALVESARRTTAVFEANTAALNALRETLAPAAAELRANMAAVPQLLEGLTKIATAQMEMMQPPKPKEQPPVRHNGPVPPRDSEAANLEYEVQQMMRAEGVSREEALLRMNSANADSVWGGGMFAGWR